MNNRENRNSSSSLNPAQTSRREFLAAGGKVLAASAVLPSILPGLYAAEDNTIRLALIGCGGRGTGAVANAARLSFLRPLGLGKKSGESAKVEPSAAHACGVLPRQDGFQLE